MVVVYAATSSAWARWLGSRGVSYVDLTYAQAIALINLTRVARSTVKYSSTFVTFL